MLNPKKKFKLQVPQINAFAFIGFNGLIPTFTPGKGAERVPGLFDDSDSAHADRAPLELNNAAGRPAEGTRDEGAVKIFHNVLNVLTCIQPAHSVSLN